VRPGGRVRDVFFSPDGRRFVTSCPQAGKSQVWDAATGQPVTPPLLHPGLQCTRMSPNGERLVTVGQDGAAVLGGLTKQTRAGPLRHAGPVVDAAFSNDDRFVATACKAHYAQVWDATTGKQVTSPLRHPEPYTVPSVAFSPDGKHVATGCGDGFVRVWNVA